MMPRRCLPLCLETTSKFGSQPQELNISLTAIGLMWNIADYFFQNREKLCQCLQSETQIFPECPGNAEMPAFDKLWMCLYTRLSALCVDPRPAVRKSAGQTLFSTISAHGGLLSPTTWHSVLWQVLFPLLDKVRSMSSSASTKKVDAGGSILIHHSRHTAQKQWAETQVLTLTGVTRVFNTKRQLLKTLGNFSKAWSLLLEFIENAALSGNNEVSLAALRSFQEMLFCNEKLGGENEKEALPADINRKEIWDAAWKVWLHIAMESLNKSNMENDLDYPLQSFLAALIQIFPSVFQHIHSRFTVADLEKLCGVLEAASDVPIFGENLSCYLPTYETSLTQLQEGILNCIELLQDNALSSPENMDKFICTIFKLLLSLCKYAYNPPSIVYMKSADQDKSDESFDEETVRGRGRPLGARTVVKSVNLKKVAEIDQKRNNHLQCNICNIQFNQLVNFANHCVKNHFNSSYYQFDCGFCYEIHTSKESLLKHIICQSGELKDKCDVAIVCPLCVLPQGNYSSENEFRDHLQQHANSQQSGNFCVLPSCNYLAYDINDLARHIIGTHTNQIVANSNCPLCKNPKSSGPHFSGPTVEPELLNSYIEEVDGADETCPLCNTVLKDHNTVLVSENEVISFEKPKYYRCTICNSGFSTQTKVTKHACRQLHTTICPECNRQFNSKKRLVFHLQSHLDPSMTLRCDVCMLTFSDETTCYDHVRFSHESETLCCDTCGKTYITRIGLSMHQMYHDDVRKFKCSDCGKRFLNQATLKEHRVSHLNVKPFQCDICGKSLSRASRLRIHLKVHSARNSTNFQKCYTCKICGFVSFSSERLLEHNVKVHNNNENDSKTSILHKLYRCEFCDNCYDMPSLLHSHRESHAPDTTENPFVCGLCNGFFKTYSRLVTHKLSHGINTETHILQMSASLESSDSFIIPQYFCCKYCDKLYEQYTAYNIHMKHSKHFVPKDKSSPKRKVLEEVKVNRKSSPKTKSTNVVEKKYKRERVEREVDLAVQNLNKENIQPVKEFKPVVRVLSNLEKLICCKCGKNFASEKLLKIHENRHNPRRKRKTYSCEDCPRFFTNKTELRKHEIVHHKPQLMCENCGKEFRYKGWYSLHVDNKVCFRTDEEEIPEELKTNLPFTDIINRILLF